MTILEYFIFAYGLYIIFAYSKMKVSGEISSQLISNKINLDRARDKAGYVKAVAPMGIAFGAVMSICAALTILADSGILSTYIRYGADIIFFIGIIVFAVFLLKAQKKYLV